MAHAKTVPLTTIPLQGRADSELASAPRDLDSTNPIESLSRTFETRRKGRENLDDYAPKARYTNHDDVVAFVSRATCASCSIGRDLKTVDERAPATR